MAVMLLLVSTFHAVTCFCMQIDFCVAVKEARIARNARRILQYLLDNLKRGQASTVESIIRCSSHYLGQLAHSEAASVKESFICYKLASSPVSAFIITGPC